MSEYKMSEILDAWESAYGEDMFIEYPAFIQRLIEEKVRHALSNQKITNSKKILIKASIVSEELDLSHSIDGEIEIEL